MMSDSQEIKLQGIKPSLPFGCDSLSSKSKSTAAGAVLLDELGRGGGYSLDVLDTGQGVSQRYRCTHCQLILNDPCQGPCGHLFCRTCLDHLLSDVETVDCPACVEAAKDDPEEIVEALTTTNVRPDKAVFREMRNLTATCPNQGCDWKLTFTQYIKTHIGECQFQLVSCEACGEEMTKVSLTCHLSDSCVQRQITCVHCDEHYTFSRHQVHVDQCRGWPVTCEHCGEQMARNQLGKHSDPQEGTCRNMPVSCKLGCQQLVNRHDMQQHICDALSQHMRLVKNDIMQVTQPTDIVGQDLLKPLSKRLLKLEHNVAEIIRDKATSCFSKPPTISYFDSKCDLDTDGPAVSGNCDFDSHFASCSSERSNSSGYNSSDSNSSNSSCRSSNSSGNVRRNMNGYISSDSSENISSEKPHGTKKSKLKVNHPASQQMSPSGSPLPTKKGNGDKSKQTTDNLKLPTGRRKKKKSGKNSNISNFESIVENSELITRRRETYIDGPGTGKASLAAKSPDDLMTEAGNWTDMFGKLGREHDYLTERLETLMRHKQADDTQLLGLERKVKLLERQLAGKDEVVTNLNLQISSMDHISHNGSLAWKITDISSKRQEARTGQTLSIFSPPFHTNAAGYKLCLRMYLNGDGAARGTHVSLFIIIMKGSFDALMPWPFTKTITLKIMDQKGSNHVVERFHPDPTDRAYHCPKHEANVGSGLPLFVHQERLDDPSQGLVVDNAMFVCAHIDCRGLPFH